MALKLWLRESHKFRVGKNRVFPAIAMAAATARVTFLFFTTAFLLEADAECSAIEP